MTDGEAYRQLGKIAEKWRNLAERRRASYRELYESGRWKRLYPEDVMLARMREVVGTAERWTEIVTRFQQDSTAAPERSEGESKPPRSAAA